MPVELDAMPQCHARKHDYVLDIFYNNIEGEAINYRAVDEGFDGLVMKPAGFTYAGFALKDCGRPAVRRSPYQQFPLRPLGRGRGLHTGFGMHSYILGLEGDAGDLARS
jgi:3-dehydroquinate dehydratase-2